MNQITNETKQDLIQYLEAIENYEAEKLEISERIKEIYDSASSKGFDVKIMKKIIKLKKVPNEKLKEEQSLLEVYADAIQLELF